MAVEQTRPGARPPSVPLLGCGAYLFLASLILGSLLLTVLLIPVRCPRNWGPCPQLLGYTSLPGVTKEEARRMLDYWEREDCSFCGKRRRVTLCEALTYRRGYWD